MMDDEETGDYESGPFCAHSAESGCGEVCMCGHRCDQHHLGWFETEECELCGCDKYMDRIVVVKGVA